ncbi:MAG: hypothetical protein WDO24_18655 [Pseudomonadota bacterium]
MKVYGISGRSSNAKSVALQVTANVLKQLVGFHFSLAEVESLLAEEEAPRHLRLSRRPRPAPRA